MLVTTLTKRLAEDITKYISELNVKAKYLHSEIDTIERMQIIRDLRNGTFDVLIGINLLREGLDIPEVALVVILDADKQGFLRSQTSLIQTCGRAARNSEGRVIMYADQMTSAIKNTIAITSERRELQIAYNKKHGITPKTIKKDITALMAPEEGEKETSKPAHRLKEEDVQKKIRYYQAEMKKAAKEMRFEDAANFRDQMRKYQNFDLAYGGEE